MSKNKRCFVLSMQQSNDRKLIEYSARLLIDLGDILHMASGSYSGNRARNIAYLARILQVVSDMLLRECKPKPDKVLPDPAIAITAPGVEGAVCDLAQALQSEEAEGDLLGILRAWAVVTVGEAAP